MQSLMRLNNIAQHRMLLSLSSPRKIMVTACTRFCTTSTLCSHPEDLLQLGSRKLPVTILKHPGITRGHGHVSASRTVPEDLSASKSQGQPRLALNHHQPSTWHIVRQRTTCPKTAAAHLSQQSSSQHTRTFISVTESSCVDRMFYDLIARSVECFPRVWESALR
jgi:hypothetical protein